MKHDYEAALLEERRWMRRFKETEGLNEHIDTVIAALEIARLHEKTNAAFEATVRTLEYIADFCVPECDGEGFEVTACCMAAAAQEALDQCRKINTTTPEKEANND